MVQWLNSKIETITGAAVLLAAASFASKALGIVRNHVLAGAFGAGDTLDAYYAAFRIPDAIFQFVVLGALSAGFIPVFMELMEKREDQWRVVSTVLNALALILGAFAAVFIIAAPYLQLLIAPGFSGEKLALTISLARMMALSPIFLGISAVFSGVLQSYRRFLVYALAPLLYNVGIIVGALWLVPLFGISGLALGVVLGALLHMAVQIPIVYSIGFRFRWFCNLKDAAVKKIAWLSIPRLLGLAVTQVNFFAITILASKLAAGSLSVFNLANDIQSVPVSLFGISLATAAFPAFSEFAARGAREEFRKSFSSTVRLILFLTVPFALLLLLLRAQIVRVLLGSGKFDWNDTITTADTLAFFSLSLFAQALIPLMVRALYAVKDTLSPFIAGGISLVVNIVLAIVFDKRMGVSGLALAFSIASIVNVISHWIVLRRRMGSLHEASIVPSLFKITAAGIAMAVVMQTIKYALAPYLNFHTALGIFVHGTISGVLGLAVFLLVALAMGSPEAQSIRDTFRKKLFRAKGAQPVEIVE